MNFKDKHSLVTENNYDSIFTNVDNLFFVFEQSIILFKCSIVNYIDTFIKYIYKKLFIIFFFGK